MSKTTNRQQPRSGVSDINPFTVKTLDSYRTQLWGKMAAAGHVPQQPLQQLFNTYSTSVAGGTSSLANQLRPAFFDTPDSTLKAVTATGNVGALGLGLEPTVARRREATPDSLPRFCRLPLTLRATRTTNHRLPPPRPHIVDRLYDPSTSTSPVLGPLRACRLSPRMADTTARTNTTESVGRPPHVLELLHVFAPRPPPLKRRVHVEDAEREQRSVEGWKCRYRNLGVPTSELLNGPPGSQGGRRVRDILNDNGSSERMLPPLGLLIAFLPMT